MIRAISAALEDDDSLVRRSALDILLQALPIDSLAVKNAPEADRVILMRAATSVVLRRDLALNRRLFSWLLGSDENSQQQMAHLKANALELLTSTLRVSAHTRVLIRVVLREADQHHRTKCSTRPRSIHRRGHSRFSSRCWTSGRLDRFLPKCLSLIVSRL